MANWSFIWYNSQSRAVSHNRNKFVDAGIRTQLIASLNATRKVEHHYYQLTGMVFEHFPYASDDRGEN